MKKILIVEDELPYLKLLNDQLTQIGYKIFEAKDGKEAMEIAKVKTPDLILLDIRMPTMDGLSMLDELRKTVWGKSVKVIILTNIEPNDRILQKVIKDKPDLYLIKSDTPFSELISQIKNFLKAS